MIQAIPTITFTNLVEIAVASFIAGAAVSAYGLYRLSKFLKGPRA